VGGGGAVPERCCSGEIRAVCRGGGGSRRGSLFGRGIIVDIFFPLCSVVGFGLDVVYVPYLVCGVVRSGKGKKGCFMLAGKDFSDFSSVNTGNVGISLS